jgi:hypothetical protein
LIRAEDIISSYQWILNLGSYSKNTPDLDDCNYGKRSQIRGQKYLTYRFKSIDQQNTKQNSKGCSVMYPGTAWRRPDLSVLPPGSLLSHLLASTSSTLHKIEQEITYRG